MACRQNTFQVWWKDGQGWLRPGLSCCDSNRDRRWTASPLREGLSVLAWGQSAIMLFTFINTFFFFFLLHQEICGILVPQPRIEPVPPAVEAQSWPLDHQGTPDIYKHIQCRVLDRLPVHSLLNAYYLWTIFTKPKGPPAEFQIEASGPS